MNDESSMNTRSDTSCRFGSTDIKCRGGMRVSMIVIALAWIARSARSAVVKLDLRDARDRERWRDALAEVEVAAYAYSQSYRAGLAGFHALERVERTSSDKVRFNHTSVIFALASNETLVSAGKNKDALLAALKGKMGTIKEDKKCCMM